MSEQQLLVAKSIRQCLETSKSATLIPDFVKTPEWTLRILAHEVAAEFRTDPNFDRQEFLTACGFGEPEVSDEETQRLNETSFTD